MVKGFIAPPTCNKGLQPLVAANLSDSVLAYPRCIGSSAVSNIGVSRIPNITRGCSPLVPQQGVN